MGIKPAASSYMSTPTCAGFEEDEKTIIIYGQDMFLSGSCYKSDIR